MGPEVELPPGSTLHDGGPVVILATECAPVPSGPPDSRCAVWSSNRVGCCHASFGGRDPGHLRTRPDVGGFHVQRHHRDVDRTA